MMSQSWVVLIVEGFPSFWIQTSPRQPTSIPRPYWCRLSPGWSGLVLSPSDLCWSLNERRKLSVVVPAAEHDLVGVEHRIDKGQDGRLERGLQFRVLNLLPAELAVDLRPFQVEGLGVGQGAEPAEVGVDLDRLLHELLER